MQAVDPRGLPGMSTSVRLGTLGEYTVSWMGSVDTDLAVFFRWRLVSASISSRIATASINTRHQQCALGQQMLSAV